MKKFITQSEIMENINNQINNEKEAIKKFEKVTVGTKEYIVLYSDRIETYTIDDFNGIGKVETSYNLKLNWKFINEQYKEIDIRR